MYKVIFIIILVIITTACSVVRKQEKALSLGSGIAFNSIDFENVKKQNISINNFYIEKAEIEILTDEGKRKILVNLKYERPVKYLLSLKSNTGIEFSRIFITRDSVFVNDRINRKLYTGSTLYLEDRYNIQIALLPLLFGDFIQENEYEINENRCSDGETNINRNINGNRMEYIIDCKLGKLVSAKQLNGIIDNRFEIFYNKFMLEGSIRLPRDIEIRNFYETELIKIRIKKIVIPWKGNLEFIPGHKYQRLELR